MLKIVISVLILQFATGNIIPVTNIHGASKLKAPILPPLPERIELNNTVIDLGTLGLENVKGLLSLCSGVMTGLNTLVDSGIGITPAPGPGQPLRQRVRFTVDIEDAAITGLYTADVELGQSEMFPQLLAVTKMTGEGHLHGSLKNGKLGIDVLVSPLSKANNNVTGIGTMISLSTLQINLQFDAAEVNLENAAVNDIPIDWEQFNIEIKQLFDFVWGQIKEPLSEFIVDLLNGIVADCTLAELIGIIGGGPTECLNLPTPRKFLTMEDEIPCEGLSTTTATTTTITELSTTSSGEQTTHPSCLKYHVKVHQRRLSNDLQQLDRHQENKPIL